jgi:hypothetical protein
MISRRSALLVALAALCALVTSCGGGGGGSSSSGSSEGGSGGGATPPPSLVFSTSSLPNGVQGQAYTQTLQATGGTAPYTWTVNTGSTAPPGLTLGTNGNLTGVPSDGYSWGFSVRVTDSGSPAQIAQKTLLLISQYTLSLADIAQLQGPTARQQYSGLIQVKGGNGSFSWQLQAGSLPPGLGFYGSDGQPVVGTGSGNFINIRGVPTMAGSYVFALQATDTGPPSQIATRTFTLVATDLPEITTDNLPLGFDQYSLFWKAGGHRRESTLFLD